MPKKELDLPEPEDGKDNEGLIKYINGQLKANKIDPRTIRTKRKKNQVHIISQSEDQINELTKTVENFIDDYYAKIAQEVSDPKVRIPLPNDELRRMLMGKNGVRINEIAKKTGTDIQVKQKEACISGPPSNQQQAAEIINDIITNKREYVLEDRTKVNVPGDALRNVIGIGHSRIKEVEQDTGALVEVIRQEIYVSGDEENVKRAILQIKNIASDHMQSKLNKQYSCDVYDYVDVANQTCDLKLECIECPNKNWKNNIEYFYIKYDEEQNDEVSCGEIDIQGVKTLLSGVLKKIKEESVNNDRVPAADLWCHFGKIFVKNVDEGDQEKRFTVTQIQENFNKLQGGWKMLFDPACQDMDIKSLEETLEAIEPISIPEHFRYDLFFLTPSCLKIRVKLFIGLDGTLDNVKFSQGEIDIREENSTDRPPLYLMCHDFHHRAKVSIAIPSHKMDVRITLRIVLPRTQDDKEKEYEDILKTYLDKIEVRDGKIVFPNDPLPEDFCLQYYRKCKRRSYKYKTGDDWFTMTLSDEQEMDVINIQSQTIVKEKTDIHLHNEEWDELLKNGDWEPEQIVKKLPNFLSCLRDLHSSSGS